MSKPKINWLGLLFLAITLGYFLIKGIVYATLGSYLPLGVILFVGTLFYLSVKSQKISPKKVIKFWSILIILWSVVRVLLWLADIFIKPVSEAHVHYQIQTGWPLSVGFLVIGLYLIYKRGSISQNLRMKASN